jgi:heavy metal sensor kinase
VLPENLENLFNPAGNPPFYFHAWIRDGSFFGAAPHAPGAIPQPARSNSANGIRTRGDLREAWSFTPPGECLLVGVSTALMEARLARFAGWLILCGAAVLALGLAGGAWLAARAIAPIGQISATAARIAAGQLSERIDTAEQESELGQLAATLNDTFARLEAAFVEQARFTSDAAHELLTPTSIILAQTQLALHRTRSAEEHQETITTVRRAAQRMQNLIDALLTLARLDAHSDPVRQISCDLPEIARETLELLRPLADKRGIHLIDELAPCTALGDPDHLSQILMNLLSNALKHCRPGDRVRLLSTHEEDRAIFRIADTGPGIAAEHLPHIFERFYRADPSRNRATGGAGLGLAICKILAEAQGGLLTVESTPQQGSTFILSLPAQSSSQPGSSSNVADGIPNEVVG